MMTWEKPEVHEVKCGMEVTSYSSAEFPEDGDLN
jgi:coenzyme PQQ precursor peptide PqqA